MAGEQTVERDFVRAEVARLWALSLLTDEPTDESNFFEEGGESLMAVEICNAVSERIGVRVSPLLFLTSDSFGEIVDSICESARAT